MIGLSSANINLGNGVAGAVAEDKLAFFMDNCGVVDGYINKSMVMTHLLCYSGGRPGDGPPPLMATTNLARSCLFEDDCSRTVNGPPPGLRRRPD